MAFTMAGGDDTPLADINTTPLVDVMLVLLIIFLIAVPVALQAVDLKIPVQTFTPNENKASNVLLSVTTTDAEGNDPGDAGYAGANPNGDCRIYRNTTPVNTAELLEWSEKHIKKEIEALGGEEAFRAGTIDIEDLPEAHIRGDINTPYKCVGGAITVMQRAGFFKIGFVSDPVR